MKNKISEIMAGCGICESGLCTFGGLSGRLLDCRAAARLPQNARTVICCIFPYKVREERPEYISRYAALPDYHRVCMPYLEAAAARLRESFKDFCFEPFIDNSPIPEVFAACNAGLGVRGENGLLINKRYGSWVFIGEIVTDMEIACESLFKRCPGCGACKKACPSGEGDCLSAISQIRGSLTESQTGLLRGSKILWGCDICAEVCPLNRDAVLTHIPEFISGYRNCYQPGEDIAGRAYEWRGKGAILRNARAVYGIESVKDTE